jgi:PAS domain S-box-containing protein
LPEYLSAPPHLGDPIVKSAEEQFLRTRDVFRLLVESVRDYAIFVLDCEGNVITWNKGAQAIKGYTREEILGQHFSKFYLRDAVESGWPGRELALAEKEGRFADEGWRVKKDGSSFWASVIITPLYDAGRLCGFAKVTQDMSERRHWEGRIHELNRELRNRVAQLDESRRIVELRTLDLQRVSAQLLQIHDEERRRVARELHDELAQQLSGIKLMLDMGGRNEQASQLTEDALRVVRDLSYLLHPPLLDETGLRAALHWYIDGLMKRSNIKISLSVRPSVFPRLPRDIEMAAFRVVQESLTNVYRHSASDVARVEIVKESESVVVRIRDYGKGLPPDLTGRIPGPRLGVGIAGMRERVRQFGGELVISRAEPGAVVEARIPFFGLGPETESRPAPPEESAKP